MKILVINSGSSSLKYQLIDMSNEEVVAKGLCERIAIDGHIKAETNTGVKVDFNIVLPNHTAAFNEVKKILTSGETKVIDSLNEISAIGHRIVQGGMYFAESHLVTKDVEDKIEELIDLAPLHNGPNLDGIRAAIKSFSPDTPHVVVFDNAFHTTMPPKAYMYAIPYRYYEEFGVRRYGFHGISHNYVSNRLQELHPEYKKVIICHL
ncbi:MAG: acetate kinase, partial [Clostridia bacterium]|nr:acetate kinase [Clostridia bacterium]